MDPVAVLKDLEDALISPEFNFEKVSDLVESYVDWTERQFKEGKSLDESQSKKFEALLILAREKSEIWDNEEDYVAFKTSAPDGGTGS